MPQTECLSQNAKDQGLLSDNLGPMAKGPKNSAAVRSRQLIHASVPVKKFLAEKYNPVLWSLLIRLDLAREAILPSKDLWGPVNVPFNHFYSTMGISCTGKSILSNESSDFNPIWRPNDHEIGRPGA